MDMSVLAEVTKEEVKEKNFLKKIKNYFNENKETIVNGMLFQNGSHISFDK